MLFLRGVGEISDGVYLLTRRQAAAVSDALSCAERALEALQNGAPTELYAQDLAECNGILSKLTGEDASEDVINEIFSKFCVGK